MRSYAVGLPVIAATSPYDFGRATYRRGHQAAVKAVVGRQAVFTTYEGNQLVGTVEPPLSGPAGTAYPIVRFSDGRWGRCNDVIDVVRR